jgi:hypothetical protein
MTTIIIPDIHDRIEKIEPLLEKLKTKHNYDNIVFLGDYFDSYKGDTFEANQTARWLKQSLQKPDRIHLLGNHDMPYMVPDNESLYCPGYTASKAHVINNVLSRDDWNKLQPAVFIQNWLISHAGFHPFHIPHNSTPATLVDKANRELAKLKDNKYSLLFDPGARMGYSLPGGITWLDLFIEFTTVPYINQIVGHSTVHNPTKIEGFESENWALDTELTTIGIIIDGKIENIGNPII